MNQELQPLLEESKTWCTKGVIIDGFVLSEAGAEEKICMDICSHIRCESNTTQAKKEYFSEFRSRQGQGKLKKIYLSDEFNDFVDGGRKGLIKYVTNKFDAEGGGGIVASGGGTGKITFKCFRHRVQTPSKKREFKRIKIL